MTLEETMARLKANGTAQNRKVYSRHGADENCFGVSFAEIEKLRKAIKCDHALALALWDSGNFDARNLAPLIADPLNMSARDLEAWTKSTSSHSHPGLISRYILPTSPHTAGKFESWLSSKHEFVAQLGWNCVSGMASWDRARPDDFFVDKLKAIEAGIHTAQNRVKHARVMALISIGLRNPKLEALALAAAKRIGKVDVDHGQTSCVTPDPAAYIAKVKARTSGKKA